MKYNSASRNLTLLMTVSVIISSIIILANVSDQFRKKLLCENLKRHTPNFLGANMMSMSYHSLRKPNPSQMRLIIVLTIFHFFVPSVGETHLPGCPVEISTNT